MKRPSGLFSRLAAVGLSCFLSSFAARANASPTPEIGSRSTEVDGLQLHYLTAGKGPALILLHGYAETSRMWRPLIPVLAERFAVIAPDLPGIGESAIPKSGLDMKSAATTIHGLAKSLGISQASVVGHDIGLMVAYAYASQFPSEVTRLVLMDAFLPGVEGWEAVYDNPGNWHFRFNGPTPAALVKGRERTYFEHYWNDFAANKNRSIPELDREAYTAAYSRPGRMEAGWAYFVAFPQTAKDFAELSKAKLTMPVLSIGGEKSLGKELGAQTRLVGTNVTVIVLKDAGHWILEEQPAATTAALVKFL
jgi:pimeloyl-ACP methyl ester carboxylesterase